MKTIESSIDVQLPIRTVYNQWTQFEDFPRFMTGVREVRQHGDVFLHWKVTIGMVTEEWESEIIEQVPDEKIEWRSIGGPLASSVISFEPLAPDVTRVHLRFDWEPHGLLERIGYLSGAVASRVESDLKGFKRFLETRGVETGAWRGAIRHGQRIE